MNLEQLVRKNILNLKAYSSARSEFKGNASIFLDANENPYNSPYNRYPDPLQMELKKKVSKVKNIDVDHIFFGNGSDEPIDLAIRVFCEPAVDNIVATDPTYGMYEVCADINNVEYRKVLLNDDFSLDADSLLAATDANTKIIFLCSPNNPTGNLLNKAEVEKVLNTFKGIVIIDEAYIDFSPNDSWLPNLKNYSNMIVLQTFSKAWGIAAVRLGMAFASTEIISYFNKVKYPYNINQFTQEFVLKEIEKEQQKNEWVDGLLRERERLTQEIEKLSYVTKIYPSDANFVLIKVHNAGEVYNYLVAKGIIIRNRNSVSLCQGALRITIGTEAENNSLLEALISFI